MPEQNALTDSISLSIDIGGSKYVVGLVDREGNILAKKRKTWNSLDSGTVMREIIESADTLLAENSFIKPSVIGATIPGLADPARGLWIEASFSGIQGIAVAEILQEHFGLPAFADNDGQACAAAEKLFGACKDVGNFIYITVSNGIGGAICIDNHLCYGEHGAAGEFGHCVVVEDGRPCKCGNHGCLEMHAAGPAISRNYRELGGTASSYSEPIDAAEIARRARLGEPAAIATFELEGRLLGKVIAMACNLVNPQKIIIGGAVSLAFSLFEASLLDTVRTHSYSRANPDIKIEPSKFGSDGGLMGAASIGFCRLEHFFCYNSTL